LGNEYFRIVGGDLIKVVIVVVEKDNSLNKTKWDATQKKRKKETFG
jgi:hypothetical protein